MKTASEHNDHQAQRHKDRELTGVACDKCGEELIYTPDHPMRNMTPEERERRLLGLPLKRPAHCPKCTAEYWLEQADPFEKLL